MPTRTRPGRRRALLAFLIGAASGVLWIAAFAVAYALAPDRADLAAPVDRVLYALRLGAWPALLLLAMVFGVIVARYASNAFNPLRDEEPRWLKSGNRVLANSVEQTAIFLPALLALAVGIDAAMAKALPLLVGFFVVSRLIFWASYLIHPLYRSPGMTGTFLVNAGTVAGALALA